MKIFLAGYRHKPLEEFLLNEVYARRKEKGMRRLLSYIRIQKSNDLETQDILQNYLDRHVEIFLDSGAYSVFKSRQVVSLDSYIKFIHRFGKYFSTYANLDVIGDVKGTLRNQKEMEKQGLVPLPCFHSGEPLKYLHYYIDNYPYFALGGVAGKLKGADAISSWLDQIFSWVGDKTKVHGFGITSVKLMLRYPWFSVDSTSWLKLGGCGKVYVAKPWSPSPGAYAIIGVSARSPTQKRVGVHLSTFPANQRQYILDYFKEKGIPLGHSDFKTEDVDYILKKNECWLSEEKNGEREVEVRGELGLCNDYRVRQLMCMLFFLDLEEKMKPWPWTYETKSESTGFGLK